MYNYVIMILQSVVITPDPSLTSVGAGLQQKSKLPDISSSQAAANWLKSAQTETTGGGAPSSAVQKAAVSIVSCADPESSARGGPTLTMFFSSDNEGERIQIPLKVGHHRPASKMPFKWCFAGGPMMVQH